MILSDLVGRNGLFVDGDWIESKNQNPDGEVRLIQLADIGQGEFKDKSSRYITSKKAEELCCTLLQKDDILIARLGEPLCKACLFPFSGLYITAVDVAILRICREDISKKFIVYLLNSPWFKNQVKTYESGTTRKRISRKNLDKIHLHIPPLSEQHRIVSRIEELFSSLDNAVATLQKTKAQLAVYRQAVLKEAFGGRLTEGWRKTHSIKTQWSTQYIESLVKKDKNSLKAGPVASSLKKEIYVPNGYKVKWQDVLTIISGKNQKAVANPSGKYPIYGSGGIMGHADAYLCEAGATIIGRKGTINKPIFVNERFWNVDTAFGVSPGPSLNPRFLYYFCCSFNFKSLDKSTTIPSLAKGDLLNIEMPVPSIKEQEEVVHEIESRLSTCDSIERTVDTALTQAESMRQSILKEAFEGRLVK